MDRRRFLMGERVAALAMTLVLSAAITGSTVLAQPSDGPTSAERVGQPPVDGRPRPEMPHREKRRLKQKLEGLPPEARRKVEENMERWKDLPPVEREKLRLRFREHHQKARAAAARMYEELGLQLDEKRRDEFFNTYFVERRHIEERLRREIEERRRRELDALREKLGRDFGAESTATSGTDGTELKTDGAASSADTVEGDPSPHGE